MPIDSGFIVHNDRTYPYLLRLFDELGVATQATDMSMSVRCDGCGLEYAGARGLGGVFADTRNAVNPRFLAMLGEVKRFHRRAREVLAAPEPDPAHVLTLGEFLARGRYSRYFTQHFMAPVVSCVWSCPPQTALAVPGPLLVRVPRPPRGTHRTRLSPLADGRRRVANLRGASRQGAHRDGARDTRPPGASHRRWGRGPR